MLQRQRQFITQVHRFVDAGVAALAFWLAHWVRGLGTVAEALQRDDITPFATYAWLLLVIIPSAPFILQAQGYYDRPVLASRRRIFWQLFWGSAWTVVVLILMSFLFRLQPARGVILLYGPTCFILMLVKEEIIRRWVMSGVGQAQMRRRIVLVGAAADTQKVRRDLVEPARVSLEVVAEVDLNQTPVEEFLGLLHEHSVNAVLLTAKHTYFGQVEKVIAACELEGVEVWLMANFFQTRISQTVVDDFAGRPMLVFRCTPDASWQALLKQLLDLLGASALLVLFSPVMVLAAGMIKLTSPGPVLFRQHRCGLNGRPFMMLKFRSMVSDAEQRRHEIEILNEMSGPVFKVTNDPRVTRVGRLLRKFSVDEFPQLLNVLRGEMSLVGPRPLPIDEVRRFDDLAHRRRLSVKPGITCLWQVSGRNNVTDFKDWVRLDLEYIDNWSLWLDLKILARTIPVVLLGTGAK
jgi:exopolysaccharide biosynthesis polyprenyl glycosylphosphotransferase